MRRTAARPTVLARAAATAALSALALVCARSSVHAQEPVRAPGSVPVGAVHAAALRGDTAAIRAQTAAGADLDARDAFGATPLVVAATFGRADAVRLLLDAGADPALANPQGATPLHVAAFLGRTDVVAALLDAGADRDRRDDDGATPYDLAARDVALDRAALDGLQAALAPLGLALDDRRIAAARPRVLALLRRPPGSRPSPDFRPAPDAGWPVATPAAVRLDPALVADLYADAATLPALRALLLVRDGRLVAERYFHEGAIDRPTLVQSVTKSVVSALVGIAQARGCLPDLDRPMLDFLPERTAAVHDPRMRAITVRHLLRMRGGFGNEGADSARWAAFVAGRYLPMLAELPLAHDPGAAFDYSNLSSHLLGAVVARACGADLQAFAERHLFAPLGVRPGEWMRDPDGFRYGYAGLHLTARDLARFGLLYLRDGEWDGESVVPAAWVRASFADTSSTVGSTFLPSGTIGRYFRDVAYGYQWWSARVGERRVDFAWGYGGQLVVLVHDLDLVIVATTDPYAHQTRRAYEARTDEQATFNVVGRFLRSLPPPD